MRFLAIRLYSEGNASAPKYSCQIHITDDDLVEDLGKMPLKQGLEALRDHHVETLLPDDDIPCRVIYDVLKASGAEDAASYADPAKLWPAPAPDDRTGAGAAPSFSAKCDKPGDKVTADVAGGVLTLTVTSPRGIGGASVAPEKGEWPRKVVVRLALKNLEAFGVECGGKELSGRLGSPPERNDGMAIEKKGEFIEVTLPEGIAAGKDAGLKISWVDFYR